MGRASAQWDPSDEPERKRSMASALNARFSRGTDLASAMLRPDTLFPIPSSLSILLPALNEERGIRKVLQEIPRKQLRMQGLAYEVFLLDGHSTDRTRSVAKKLGAEIFVQKGRGKGSAFREFLPRIRGDVTVLLDSDGTYPPDAIPHLVGALGANSPVVLGSRLRDSRIQEGAMSPVNYLGNRILSKLASILFGVPISDVCSGMWAFVSDRLKTLDLSAEGFELEVDIFAECALRRIPIAEVPIAYRRRIGRPKLRVSTGLRIAVALLKKRVRSRLDKPEGIATEVPSATGHARRRGADWGDRS